MREPCLAALGLVEDEAFWSFLITEYKFRKFRNSFMNNRCNCHDIQSNGDTTI